MDGSKEQNRSNYAPANRGGFAGSSKLDFDPAPKRQT